jgi:Na+-transporting NADH:ubiquinone oxidoreductase subunit NqrD
VLKRETKSYDQFHFDSIKLYHGGNKLSVIELMMRSAFYQTNKISWNFIVLANRNVTPLGHFILKPIRTRDRMVIELITTDVVSSNIDQVVQHYVIKFVSDLRHFVGFLRVLRFPPPIKLTATI